MAQKKISDLTLISALADGVAVPAHDGIATYKFTIAQLKAFLLGDESILLNMLDTDILNGLTAVTPQSDDYLALVDTSDSNKTKKVLASNFLQAAYRAATTTDATTVNDGTVKLSGASFTATLPTAVGCAGRRIRYVHAGTSLTQLYTIATTSSQTVGGLASGAFVLWTNGEVLEVESNGANWEIVGRKTSIVEQDAGVLTFTATTTAPTKGTTSLDKITWSREGEFAIINYRYVQTAGGAAGSGDYKLNLPAGMVADATQTPVYTTVASLMGTRDAWKAVLPTYQGGGYSGDVGILGPVQAFLFSTTTLRIGGIYAATNAFNWSSGIAPLNVTSMAVNFTVRVKIAGWQP